MLQTKVYRALKLADSSIGYNMRMVGVRPNGMLVYYSKVIDEVRTKDIEKIKIPPKAGVYIDQIIDVKLSIIKFDKIEMTLIFPKN